MGPAHVPVKILRLQVKREYIGQQRIQRPGDVANGLGVEISRSSERCFPTLDELGAVGGIHKSGNLVPKSQLRNWTATFFQSSFRNEIPRLQGTLKPVAIYYCNFKLADWMTCPIGPP